MSTPVCGFGVECARLAAITEVCEAMRSTNYSTYSGESKRTPKYCAQIARLHRKSKFSALPVVDLHLCAKECCILSSSPGLAGRACARTLPGSACTLLSPSYHLPRLKLILAYKQIEF